MQPTLIVLAAGMGKRYGNLKQLDGVGPNGETMMDYAIYDAIQAGFGKVVFIIRNHFRIPFEALFLHRYGDSIEIAIVEQEPEKELPVGFYPPPERSKPWGTGHALLMAASETETPFLVINADDFYGREAFQIMGHFLRCHASLTGCYAMVGYQIGHTLSDSGGVSRGICCVDDQNMLTQVVERHQIRAIAPDQIVYETTPGCVIEVAPTTPVSMNFWGFTPDFFSALRKAFHQFIWEHGSDPNSEFYIPTVANQLIQSREASVEVLFSQSSWFGITYPQDRPYVTARFQQLISQGVYPASILDQW